MKKLLGISLVAMMAVTSANAQIASKAYVDEGDTAVRTIIGALNNLNTSEKTNVVAAINSINTSVGALGTMSAESADDYYTAAETDTVAANAVKSGVSASGSNGVSASATDGAITVAGVAATTSAAGVVQLADAAAVTAGTSGRVVDAAQLKSVADTAGGNLTTALADYTPTADLGNMAFEDKDDYATASQGSKADTALQPADVTASGSNGVNASASNGAITVTGVAATTSAAGVVQLADAAAVTAGTSGRVVDAAQLKAVADGASTNYQAKSTANYSMGKSDGTWEAMTQAQQDALNSGATATNIGKIATNESAIATINASDPMTSGITAAKVATYDAYATGKQDALGYTAENAANKVTSVTASSSDTEYPSAKAVFDAMDGLYGDVDDELALKQDKLNDTNVVNGTGTGNVVTSVVASDGTVTVDKTITAIPQPTATNETGTLVLTATSNGNGGYTYQWEQITRESPAQ